MNLYVFFLQLVPLTFILPHRIDSRTVDCPGMTSAPPQPPSYFLPRLDLGSPLESVNAFGMRLYLQCLPSRCRRFYPSLCSSVFGVWMRGRTMIGLWIFAVHAFLPWLVASGAPTSYSIVFVSSRTRMLRSFSGFPFCTPRVSLEAGCP